MSEQKIPHECSRHKSISKCGCRYVQFDTCSKISSPLALAPGIFTTEAEAAKRFCSSAANGTADSRNASKPLTFVTFCGRQGVLNSQGLRTAGLIVSEEHLHLLMMQQKRCRNYQEYSGCSMVARVCS